jgi:tetratricopeptide (TPR) repeat protein
MLEWLFKRLVLDSPEPELAGPESAQVWWEKGRALAEEGAYDQAIACFDKAIEVDPRDTANYCERGKFLPAQG